MSEKKLLKMPGEEVTACERVVHNQTKGAV